MPVCVACGEKKPAGDFYQRDRSCKECRKARVKLRARLNPAVQEYDRQRAKTPERREHIRATVARWNAENPLGYKAHYVATNAVRDGRLKKQLCLFCGRSDVHAHHRDYSKPLDVVWLCPQCHHRLHALGPEIQGKGV